MRKWTIVLVVLCIGMAGISAGGATYNPPIDLGSFGLGEDQAWAFAINDSGQVVGYGYPPSGGWHGFLWTQDNGMQDIAPSGTNWHRAEGINNGGTIVGWTPEGAFVYESGYNQIVGNGLGRLYDINDYGIAVGTDEFHGFSTTSPAIFDIATDQVQAVPGLAGTLGKAWGINPLDM